MPFQVVKARKDCMVCKRPLFKGERYFRTWDKGKSLCLHCLKDAYECMQNGTEWVKNSEDYKIIKASTYSCSICNTVNNLRSMKVMYLYSVYTYRRWVTRSSSVYVCEKCLADFVNSLTKDEIETSEANRFERAIINL